MKTYATVRGEGMIYKLLETIRCRKTVRLLDTTISSRYFCACLGGNVSKERKLSNGLPQSSVLAPVFNLYTSDLSNTKSTKLCYTDDIALVCRITDLRQAETIITEDLAVVNSYFKRWRLRPSTSKTEVYTFHLNSNQANSELRVQLNGNTCCHNEWPKYLGVILDCILSYKTHLENSAVKIKTRNTIIQKLRGATREALADIVRIPFIALVFSTREYCAPL
ncbi:hypothetical protein Trydic_g924 [Trypoxylus dichotomus]